MFNPNSLKYTISSTFNFETLKQFLFDFSVNVVFQYKWIHIWGILHSILKPEVLNLKFLYIMYHKSVAYFVIFCQICFLMFMKKFVTKDFRYLLYSHEQYVLGT